MGRKQPVEQACVALYAFLKSCITTCAAYLQHLTCDSETARKGSKKKKKETETAVTTRTPTPLAILQHSSFPRCYILLCNLPSPLRCCHFPLAQSGFLYTPWTAIGREGSKEEGRGRLGGGGGGRRRMNARLHSTGADVKTSPLPSPPQQVGSQKNKSAMTTDSAMI